MKLVLLKKVELINLINELFNHLVSEDKNWGIIFNLFFPCIYIQKQAAVVNVSNSIHLQSIHHFLLPASF